MPAKNRFSPKFEKLEQKQLLAGDVFVSVANGSLLIEGDAQDNQVSVSAGDERGSFIVRGENGTNVNYEGSEGDSQEVSGVRRDIVVNTGGGDDSVTIDGVRARRLTVRTGAGNDVVSVLNSRAVDLAFATGSGNDAASVSNTRINRGNLSTNRGSDVVTVSDLSARRLQINGGSGADSISVTDSAIRDLLNINNGRGNQDAVVVDNVNARRTVVPELQAPEQPSETPTSVPTTIDEARAAGIEISDRVARLGDLNTLLTRSLVRTGFLDTLSRGDATELRRIRREFADLVEQIEAGGNQDPGNEPGPEVDQGAGSDQGAGNDQDNGGDQDTGNDQGVGDTQGLTTEQADFVNRFRVPQDVLDELTRLNSLDRVIGRVARQLSNPSNIVALGNGLFEDSIGINQGTITTRVVRTRDQLVANFSFGYLFDSLFNSRAQTPNTAATFDRIAEEVFADFEASLQS